MQKIQSFQIDHTTLMPGIYISRVDGDITTFDLRFVRPNTPPFLEQAGMHTIEHLFATFVRNSPLADRVIYFGPMGCRTGFYFLTRGVAPQEVLALTRQTLRFIAEFEGEIPGASAVECGNWLEHDLPKAREYAAKMTEILADWSVAAMDYAFHTKGAKCSES